MKSYWTMRFALRLLGLCVLASLSVGLLGACSPSGSQPMGALSRHDTPTTAQSQAQPFFFILAGDPQIGGWNDFEGSRARMIRLAQIANDLKPAFVIVAGDLVNDGPHKVELAAFDEALAQFKVPVRLLIGNHDDAVTYREKYGSDHYSFTFNGSEFIILNSNLLTGIHPSGRQMDEQWQWLAETLKSARQRNPNHIFLAMHHPPSFLPAASKRLVGLLREYDVEVILCGHVHRTQEYLYKGLAVFTVAGTARAFDHREFGYRVFKVYPDRIEQDYLTIDRPAEPVRLESNTAAKP